MFDQFVWTENLRTSQRTDDFVTKVLRYYNAFDGFRLDERWCLVL